MRIAVATLALRLPTDPTRWITVPPQGYSGVHWVVANLIDGLLSRGHEVVLLGAPGTCEWHPSLSVVDIATDAEIYEWLDTAEVDLLHDHSCGQLDPARIAAKVPYVSTHHMTGDGRSPDRCIYLSLAQRTAAGRTGAPVIRIPVNAKRYHFRQAKDDYLLFLGRISAFKGALEAASFAQAAGLRLVLAGPSWESEYRAEIRDAFGATAEFVGEVGGARRLELIAGATAVLALSQSVMGPWGALWCEPGSTVVSEAAVSGTPVIGTANGCLAEIVPEVGVLVPEGKSFTRADAHRALSSLPSPETVRDKAIALWGHEVIAAQHEMVYAGVISGESW